MSCIQFFSFVIPCEHDVTWYIFFCPTAFRFPLKLAISCVVSCIGLYQVTAQCHSDSGESVLCNQEVKTSTITENFLFSGGPFIDLRCGATSADSPYGSG